MVDTRPMTRRCSPTAACCTAAPVQLVRARASAAGAGDRRWCSVAPPLVSRAAGCARCVLVAATVLVGQVVARLAQRPGRPRPRRARTSAPDKPLADGRLDPGTVWFAVACARAAGRPAVARATASTAGLRVPALAGGRRCSATWRCARTALSWLPWAASFALLPGVPRPTAAGAARPTGDPPTAVDDRAGRRCSGVGVHFLTALPDLVADNEDGLRPPAAARRRCGSARPGCWWSRSWRRCLAASIVVAGLTVGCASRPAASERWRTARHGPLGCRTHRCRPRRPVTHATVDAPLAARRRRGALVLAVPGLSARAASTTRPTRSTRRAWAPTTAPATSTSSARWSWPAQDGSGTFVASLVEQRRPTRRHSCDHA